MQYIYDLVPVVILVVCFAVYYKKGLLGILLRALCWLIALVLAWFMSSMFAGTSVTVAGNDVSATRPILFFAVFLVASIILTLVSKSLQALIDKIPLVGSTNHVLGGLVGLALGVLCCVILINLTAILIYASRESLPWMNSALIEQTLWFKYAYRYNLLEYSPFP